MDINDIIQQFFARVETVLVIYERNLYTFKAPYRATALGHLTIEHNTFPRYIDRDDSQGGPEIPIVLGVAHVWQAGDPSPAPERTGGTWTWAACATTPSLHRVVVRGAIGREAALALLQTAINEAERKGL